jgi:5-enolpyruvylshikimate-3-phosphate synthase
MFPSKETESVDRVLNMLLKLGLISHETNDQIYIRHLDNLVKRNKND